ncbi:MAG TPA: hypothetical protein VGF48_23975 [Thermoanaerobaculia bacterium]
MRPHRLVLAILYLVAFAALAHYLTEGWSYYRTPLIERPHHPQFWSLKPGGSLGKAFGMIGAGLMTVMLLYSVRKRVRPLRKAGPLSIWLDFHIFCGVIGPLLVILHSSFKVQGLVAVSFWSMIAVALSGVLGRYLYLQIPRTRAGDERTLADVQEELRALDESPDGTSAAALQKRKAWLQRRIARWHRTQELFHYWHVFHKPFAILMYLFLIVHIAVVTLTGYGFR